MTGEIFIARSAQAIWDGMGAAALLPLVDPRITRLEPVAGTGPGVGRQHTYVVDLAGSRQFVIHELIEAFPPGYRVERLQPQSAPASTHRTWIEHTGAGCWVRRQVEHELPLSWTPAGRAELAGAVHAELTERLARWKQLLESEPPRPPMSP